MIVLTTDGIGSGVYIGSDQIITNWHVVKGYKTVGVVFKPVVEGTAPTKSNVVRAEVLKTNAEKDLALLRVTSLPQNIRLLELGGEKDIQIGGDVHAIGHPTGAVWTYTKGLISQIRRNYEWKTESNTHKANVI